MAQFEAKYAYTPEFDAAVVSLYRNAKCREDVTVGLTELARRGGVPRKVVALRAQHLNLRFCTRIPWQNGELERLRNLAGELPLRKIAYKLGRSYGSVRQKMFQLGITNEQFTSYSFRQLGELMGVSHHAVSRWIAQGFMVAVDGRVPEWSVGRFVWQHMDKYRFASADEFFLKTMLKMNPPSSFRGAGRTGQD